MKNLHMTRPKLQCTFTQKLLLSVQLQRIPVTFPSRMAPEFEYIILPLLFLWWMEKKRDRQTDGPRGKTNRQMVQWIGRFRIRQLQCACSQVGRLRQAGRQFHCRQIKIHVHHWMDVCSFCVHFNANSAISINTTLFCFWFKMESSSLGHA